MEIPMFPPECDDINCTSLTLDDGPLEKRHQFFLMCIKSEHETPCLFLGVPECDVCGEYDPYSKERYAFVAGHRIIIKCPNTKEIK